MRRLALIACALLAPFAVACSSNNNKKSSPTTLATVVHTAATASPTRSPSPMPSPSPSPTPPPTGMPTNSPSVTPGVATPTQPPATQPSPAATVAIALDEHAAFPGGTASLTASAPPGALCSLTYTTPAGTVSTASGLGMKMVDASGRVAWTWTISGNTEPGQGTVTVRCMPGGTATTSITINRRPL